MKTVTIAALTALLLLTLGCSEEKSTGPGAEAPLNFDVIGDDAPQGADAALQELSEMSIAVPNPVESDDPVLSQNASDESISVALERSSLDDPGRAEIRRILNHLHEQQQMLRRCMESNDDPELRRLAHGSSQAIQRGLRALENGNPRAALQFFRVANRVMNVALAHCRGRG